MSKSVIENSNDFYGLWKEYTDNVFSYVESTVPKYHQSITNLLQETIQIWKNVSCSAIEIQRGFVAKAGLRTNMPHTAVKMVDDITKQSKTLIDVQNKIAIASIDASKQSLNTLNANAGEFASINKNIIELLPSMLPARS